MEKIVKEDSIIGGWTGLYSLEEIQEKHVTQLSASGCGATAVVNVLLLFNQISKEQISTIDWSVCVLRTRANNATIFPYLLSRYDAGCTGEELIQSMEAISSRNKDVLRSTITGKFVPYEKIAGRSIVDFLQEQLLLGNVPIATLNLQVLGNDAWHHQIVFAVETAARTIHALNPIEKYPETVFRQLISTKSVLLVRREDVLSRVTPELLSYCQSYYLVVAASQQTSQTDLVSSLDGQEDDKNCKESDLFTHRNLYGSDRFLEEPWKSFEIIKQIAIMIHQADIHYLVIPAAYKGGFAIFSNQSNVQA